MLRRHLRDFATARMIVPALCLALSLTGCSGGGSSHNDSTTDTPPSVSTTVSATQGGTVTGPDGVQVIVPANALAADTQITIKKSTASSAPLKLGDGAVLPVSTDTVYELLPHGVKFNTPVTLRIPVSGDTSELTAYISEPDSGWYPVATSAGSGFLEFTRSDFSTVAVASNDMMRWTLSRLQHLNIAGGNGVIQRAVYDVSSATISVPTDSEVAFDVDFSLNLGANSFNGSACSDAKIALVSLDGVALNQASNASASQTASELKLHATETMTFDATEAGVRTLVLEVRCALFPLNPPQLRLKVNVIPQSQWRDDRYAFYYSSSSALYQNNLSSAGEVIPLSPASIALSAAATTLTSSRSGNSIYIGQNSAISQFSIGDDGGLAARASLSIEAVPMVATVAPSDDFVYFLDGLGSNFLQYSIGSQGALSALKPVAIATGVASPVIFAHAMAITPDGRYLYAVLHNSIELNYDPLRQPIRIGQFARGADGTLSPLTPSSISRVFYSGAAIAAHPLGKYVYYAQGTASGFFNRAVEITQYEIGSDGQLKELNTQSFNGANLIDMVVDPTGKSLYLATTQGIAQYAIGEKGTLARIASDLAAGATSFSRLMADPSGRFLFALSSDKQTLLRYSIGSDGALTASETIALTGAADTVGIAKYSPAPVSVGGTAALNGDTVTLQLNGGSNLTLSSDGAFVFDAVLGGGSYTVTVLTQPGNGDICTITQGSGTIGSASISNVGVTCAPPTYRVNVVVSGLTAGDSVTLLNNGGNALNVGMNGSSNFSSTLLSGAAYNVTVQSQTAGQACSVSNGSGTINAAAVDVTISCAVQSYTVGGNVSGLANSNNTVTLQLSSGGNSTSTVVTGNSAFTLNPALLHGASYTVSVLQSPGNSCSVSAGGSGTVAAANITSVAISCSALHYSIGGSISNLGSAGLVLANGTDMRSVSAGATTFTMPTSQISGTPYYITVHQQPSGDTCAVTSQGAAVVGSVNVTDITVVCAANQYTVDGSVSGLANSNDTVTLQLSDGTTPTNTIVTGNSSFTLSPNLPDGANYTVTVVGQPSGQVCSVTGGSSGTISAASVGNVMVSCQSSGGGPYVIGGTVVGLMPGSTVVLQNNSGDNLTVTGTGSPVSFQFATPVAGSYDVTVQSHSMDVMMCSVSGGAGTASADVTTIGVTCF